MQQGTKSHLIGGFFAIGSAPTIEPLVKDTRENTGHGAFTKRSKNRHIFRGAKEVGIGGASRARPLEHQVSNENVARKVLQITRRRIKICSRIYPGEGGYEYRLALSNLIVVPAKSRSTARSYQ